MPIAGQITVNAGTFAAATQWVAKWVTAKPVVPIHGGITLTVASGGLTLGAFSENEIARADVEITGPAPISAAPQRAIVSGRLLAELSGALDRRDVVIGNDTDAITLTSGRFVATLPTMPEADYPALPGSLPVLGEVDGAALAAAVKRVGVTPDPGAGNVQFTALYLGFGGNGWLTVMGTQLARTAVARIPWTFNEELSDSELIDCATPLASVLVDGTASLGDQGVMEVGCDGRSLSLTSATRSLTVRLLDLRDSVSGELTWPVAILNRTFAVEHPHAVTLNRAELAMPLKRATIMRGPKGPVRVTFAPGAMTIGAVGGESRRSSDDVVTIDYDGPEVALGVDPGFLAEALRSAPGDTVRIAFAEPRRHLSLTCDADPTWQHALMPMRIN